jgi:hypothetical protein
LHQDIRLGGRLAPAHRLRTPSVETAEGVGAAKRSPSGVVTGAAVSAVARVLQYQPLALAELNASSQGEALVLPGHSNSSGMWIAERVDRIQFKVKRTRATPDLSGTQEAL